jgi:hypothetical protein
MDWVKPFPLPNPHKNSHIPIPNPPQSPALICNIFANRHINDFLSKERKSIPLFDMQYSIKLFLFVLSHFHTHVLKRYSTFFLRKG